MKNNATQGSNQEGHPADDLRENSQRFDPILIAKTNRAIKKELKVEYLSIAPRKVFLKPVTLMHSSSKLEISKMAKYSRDEAIFKIILLGKTDKEYDLKVKEGDFVQVSAVEGMVHLPHTLAITSSGKRVDGVYVTETRNILSKVNYTRM